MIYAVVPAAGKSSRMGRPKLMLPLGDRTVIEQVVAALRAAEIEHILVVVGPGASELAALAERAGADVQVLAEETPDMRATVESGLTWLSQRFQPAPNDAWLLIPADHPTLSPGIIRLLLDAWRANPERSLFVPTHNGRRGHPTLLVWRHTEGIRRWPAASGLNAYLRHHAAELMEIPTPDADILRDLDTPADYEALRGQRAGSRSP